MVLLALLLPPHTPPHCEGGSHQLGAASESRRDAGSPRGGRMVLPAELERLLSVQRSNQPSIFISSPVILIFSGF